MRAKGKGQNKFNSKWLNQQSNRRDNLEREFESSAGVTDKNRHLFTGKVTKHNPCGINHALLRDG